MVTDMEPTYFLYAGKLFHDTALAFLGPMPKRGEDGTSEPSRPPRRGEDNAGPLQPRRGEDPGPAPQSGEGDEDLGRSSKPIPGPGAPLVPEHGSPDANPIDPRVF